jgi:hypothetical protein
MLRTLVEKCAVCCGGKNLLVLFGILPFFKRTQLEIQLPPTASDHFALKKAKQEELVGLSSVNHHFSIDPLSCGRHPLKYAEQHVPGR